MIISSATAAYQALINWTPKADKRTFRPTTPIRMPLPRYAPRYRFNNFIKLPYNVGPFRSMIDVHLHNIPIQLGFSANPVLEAIRKVVPATVQIKVAGANGKNWSGSGFIMHPADVTKFFGIPYKKGYYYVHTNHHVANDGKIIEILTPDGKFKLLAEVVKNKDGKLVMSQKGDTALLMVKATDLKEPLPVARIASRFDYEQGSVVLAAGYPLGLPKVSVTKGIISQLEQEVDIKDLTVIQTDAHINPGNSGGPLFTLDGVIIGTNTFGFQGSEGMGFAYAIEDQFRILNTILHSIKLNT